MTTNTTSSMFDSIKNSLKNKKGNESFKNILKTEIDKNYLIRFLPNKNTNPVQTFYHYYHHTWQSKATGQYVGGLCLSTIDERCPICEQRFKLYNSKDTAKQDLSKLINRKENWLVNCYVINDPTKPENEKSVKIFRFGKQVKDIIANAFDGVDAKEVGPDAMFDLTQNGCNFRIAVKKNEGGYATYIYSKFLNKSAIDGMTPEKIKDILEKQTHDLTQINKQLTKKELQDIMDEHLFCKGASTEVSNDVPVSDGTVITEKKSVNAPTPKKPQVEEISEEEATLIAEAEAVAGDTGSIDDLLAGLDK